MEMPLVVEPTLARKGQSIFGVISFGIGLVSATMVCGGIALLVFLAYQERGRFDPASAGALLPAFCALAGGPLAMLGVGSGVIALFEENRAKALGIMGIVLNLLGMLVLAGTIVLGLIARGRGLPPNL